MEQDMSKASIFPIYILRTLVSQTAKLLFIELPLSSSQKRPNVFIDHEKLANNLGSV